jgi:hypothetical protein
MGNATVEATIAFAIPCIITFISTEVEIIPLVSIDKINSYFIRIDNLSYNSEPRFVIVTCKGDVYITSWKLPERVSYILEMASGHPVTMSLLDIKLSADKDQNMLIDNLLKSYLGSEM